LFNAGHGSESLLVSLTELKSALAYGVVVVETAMTDLMLVRGLVPSGLGEVRGSDTDEFDREGFGSGSGTVASQFSHVSRDVVEARFALVGGCADFFDDLRRTGGLAGLGSSRPCSFQNELPISRYAISSAAEGTGDRDVVLLLPVVALLFSGCGFGEGLRLFLPEPGMGDLERFGD